MPFRIDDKWIAEHRVVYPEQFSKMSYSERLDLYKNNREQYDSLLASEQVKHPSYNHSKELQKLASRPARVNRIVIKG